MTASAKTLRAIERMAMRWYRLRERFAAGAVPNWAPLRHLHTACEHHATALKRKRTGKKVRQQEKS